MRDDWLHHETQAHRIEWRKDQDAYHHLGRRLISWLTWVRIAMLPPLLMRSLRFC